MSFDEINKANPPAADFFRLLAFFNPDGILIEFLRAGVEGMVDDLGQLVSDEFELANALISLETSSLVKWHRQNGIISVHRLVQAVVKDEMSDDDFQSLRTKANEICNRAFPKEWDNVRDRERCRLYVGQVIGPLSDSELLESETSARTLLLVGRFLRDEGKYFDSERLLKSCVVICERLFGDEHNGTLAAKLDLASTYLALGKLNEAARLGEEVLEKRRRMLGPEDDPATFTTLENLATTYRGQGKMEEAAVLEEKVLDGRTRILGQEHADTLTTLANLGTIYQAQGKIVEAAVLVVKVLDARMRILGAEHPDTLTAIADLGSIYQAQGQLVEATALEEKVLDGRMRILGPEHPDTLTTVANLATIYQAQGKTVEAATLGEEVLEKRRSILGEEHPATLTSMHHLAHLYEEDGKAEEAQKLREEIWASIQRGKGSVQLREYYAS
jgi:tetratricopeptide (TPR) repeat protein